ncbi:MAG: hypothetical protein HeimC3_14120 [Candidatus Heimdallarchaeota archaeon LC_3]|nr:MAG: hypothetical protein HeimC3_14120 [Candidatus Heimdallarchaeota archaeon LC_3]
MKIRLLDFFFPRINSPSDEYSQKMRISVTVLVLSIFVFLFFQSVYVLEPKFFNLSSFVRYERYPTILTFNTLLGPIFLSLGLTWLIKFIFLFRRGVSRIENQVLQSNVSNRDSKLLLFILNIIFVFMTVSIGYYGYNLSLASIFLISLQIGFATLIVIILDDILTSGWGYGNGFLIFSSGIILTNFIWNLFAIFPFADGIVETGGFTLPIGVFIAVVQVFLQFGIVEAFSTLFIRVEHPTNSIFSFLSTLALVFIIYWLLSKENSKKHNHNEEYSKNNLDRNQKVASIDIILITTFTLCFFTLLFILSEFLQSIIPGFIIADLLGQFDPEIMQPTSGIVYFLPLVNDSLFSLLLKGQYDQIFTLVVQNIILMITLVLTFFIYNLSKGNYQHQSPERMEAVSQFSAKTTIYQLIILVTLFNIIGTAIPSLTCVLIVAIIFFLRNEYSFSDVPILKYSFYTVLVGALGFFILFFINIIETPLFTGLGGPLNIVINIVGLTSLYIILTIIMFKNRKNYQINKLKQI